MCTGNPITARKYTQMASVVKGQPTLERDEVAPINTPTPSEPEPKSRTINRTVKPGTTVRGQQTTQSAAPSRRRIKSARMGRRSGTSSLRIARNPNTGSGNLNY